MAILINGNPKELKFTLSAARRFRAVTVSVDEPKGLPIWKTRLNDEDGLVRMLDVDILVKVVWAGLLHTDKALTVEAAEAILDEYIQKDPENALPTLYKEIVEAFEASGLFGLKRGTEKDEDAPAGEIPNESGE